STCTITGDPTGNLIGVDPKLAPLASNGGPTQTHALLATSPAIDAGDISCASTDQRGLSRQGTCDMGAFEFGCFAWRTNGPNSGSEIATLAVDQQASGTLYAGTFSSQGVLKSTNGGSIWSLSNNGLGGANVFALAIDPLSHQTLYAGTSGSGVFKSTDGGGS